MNFQNKDVIKTVYGSYHKGKLGSIICPECGKRAKCDYCKRKLKEGEFIICYREGAKHFCSDDCMLAYFKKFAVETWACPYE